MTVKPRLQSIGTHGASRPRPPLPSGYVRLGMGDWVEVWTAGDRRLVPLEGERVTVGAAPGNDLCLEGDTTVSRLHAVLERMGDFWTIRDLGSRNGVFVNGERLARDRV